MSIDHDQIVGVLLAGGQSRRMGGGDKCLIEIDGKSVLQRVIDRIQPAVGTIVLNANGNTSRFDSYGMTVIPDSVGGFAGPLAGVLTGMEWAAAHHPACTHIATIPTDGPFLPKDLIERLWAPIARDEADLTCAESGGRRHPVIGIWPCALHENLRHALEVEDIRKVDRWTARFRVASVSFSTDPFDPFFNMNHPDDIETAEAMARRNGL